MVVFLDFCFKVAIRRILSFRGPILKRAVAEFPSRRYIFYMLRLLTISILVVVGLALLTPLLPYPLARASQYIVNTAMGLACPMFFFSLFFAPGLYRQLSDELRQVFERLRGRRLEIEDLQRKIANMNKPHHMAQLGQLYLRQGRQSKAIPWFERTLEADPEHLEATYRLGMCYFDKGQYDKAVNFFEKVHSIKPDHDYGHAYLRLAQTHQRLGNAQRAAEVYDQLLRFYPGQPEGTYDYALLSQEQGDMRKSIRLMRDVVFSVRHSPRFHRRRNRHLLWKAQWWLWRHAGSASSPS